LRKTMELLHPFMPFITEEIWQHLPHQGQTIMQTSWNSGDEQWLDEQAEQQMGVIAEVVKAIRNLRSEMNVPPGKKAEAILFGQDQEMVDTLERGRGYLINLGGLSELVISLTKQEKPDQAVTAIVSGVEVYLPLKGLVDLEKEVLRLQKELDNLEKEISRLNGKLSNDSFTAKAPADVIGKEREKLRDYESKRDAVKERIASLR